MVIVSLPPPLTPSSICTLHYELAMTEIYICKKSGRDITIHHDTYYNYSSYNSAVTDYIIPQHGCNVFQLLLLHTNYLAVKKLLLPTYAHNWIKHVRLHNHGSSTNLDSLISQFNEYSPRLALATYCCSDSVESFSTTSHSLKGQGQTDSHVSNHNGKITQLCSLSLQPSGLEHATHTPPQGKIQPLYITILGWLQRPSLS